MDGGSGLRERKKLRTRQAIVESALELFDRRGFDATTIADIAAAADISPRTFFAYFPGKEDVCFASFDDDLASLRARLHEREPGETAIDALRAWIAAYVEEQGLDDPMERCRKRVVDQTPVLRDRSRALMSRFEAELTAAVAVDMGIDPAALRPRMVAAAATAAMMTIEELVEGENPPDDPFEPLDDALDFVRGGIDALGERPPS
jgi:AcrR family transcriptional regulator